MPYDDSNSTGAAPDPSIDGLTDSGGAFVFTRTANLWSPGGFLKAGVPGANDRFGSNVAIDGNVIIAAAPFEDGGGSGVNPTVDEGATDAGAVYVHLRTSTTFAFHAYLKPLATDANDLFAGLSVDRGRIFIGSRFEDGNGLDPADDSVRDSGEAYLFE